MSPLDDYGCKFNPSLIDGGFITFDFERQALDISAVENHY